mmetsp:Transcript_13652/g.36659  ORF Transcript_13652/g.36659 Transcript_13652/m.36659 type:complete len:261 (-) Transcript_13652:3531-4313(-)
MIPAPCLSAKRDRGCTTATKHNRGERDAFWRVPFGIEHRTKARSARVARVRMSSLATTCWRPFLICPVLQHRRRFERHSFPPNVAIRGECDVGEEAVAFQSLHGGVIRYIACAWCNSEKAGLRIDRPQTPIVADMYPSNVIAYNTYFVARKFWCRHHHAQIRLSACTREGRSDKVLLAARACEAKNQHVLSHPTFFPSKHGGNAKGKALFSQNRIAPEPAAVTPYRRHLPVRKVYDTLLFVVARPATVFLSRFQRAPHGM